MALLNILKFPDPRLRKIAQPIEEIDDSIRQLAVDMLETMYAAPGVGLAAPQVGVGKRHAFHLLGDDGVDGVDQFLHGRLRQG